MSSQTALLSPGTQISRSSFHEKPSAKDPQSPADAHYPGVFRRGGSTFLQEIGQRLALGLHGEEDTSDICLDLGGYTASHPGEKIYKGYKTKKAVLKLAFRIRSLKLGREIPGGFRELYNPSSTFSGQFARLEHLAIDIPHQYTEPEPRAKGDSPLSMKSLLACLADIDSLRQLHLNFGPYDQANLTASCHYESLFERLTHVSLLASMTVNECLSLLSHCTNAVEINLDIPNVLETYPKSDDPKAQRRLLPRLPKLRWLKIATNDCVEAILQCIECPNLENLFILNGTPPEPFAEDKSERQVYPYRKLPAKFWDTVHFLLASCVHLKQLVLAVNCSWKVMRTHALCLESIKDIPEVDLRVMDPEEQDRAPKNVIGHWFGMTACNSHDGYISHVGKTGREGVHMGTYLRPVDWDLGFWHTEDDLDDLALSGPWKNSMPSALASTDCEEVI